MAAVHGAEQVPVLGHPDPGTGAGRRPHALQRGLAGPVPGAPHRGLRPRQHVPPGRDRLEGAAAPPWTRRGRGWDWPGPSRERHIVVFVRGNMFRLDVIGSKGRPHTLDEIAAGLDAVMEAGATPAARGTAVGHLTTKARAEWAASRQALLDCDPGNAEKLDVVETALFCLCLEDTTPEGPREASDLLLHGDSGNRWFDSSAE